MGWSRITLDRSARRGGSTLSRPLVGTPLLDGTTNWPAVLEAFDAAKYPGYLTFEYFHPYQHFPEALVYQTADSLDRMLGIKG